MRTVGDLLRQLKNVHTEKPVLFHFRGIGHECTTMYENDVVEITCSERAGTLPDYTRFRCNNGPDCPYCKGRGYTVGADVLREWALLTGDIDRQVAAYRQRLTHDLTKSFDAKYPSETPQCKTHPNTLAYIAERQTASSATTGSTNATHRAGLLRRSMSTIGWGLRSLASKVMAGRSSKSPT